MPGLICESFNLVFNRRTVSGTATFDSPCKEGRLVKPGSQDIMYFLVGIGDIATLLFRQFGCVCKREFLRIFIPALFFHAVEIQRTAIYPDRCSGFQAARFK